MDPLAPPRPNLLSQAKEIKDVKLHFDLINQELIRHNAEMGEIKAKLRAANYRIEMLTSYLQNNKK